MFGCRRIQAQHDHLEKEYREHALGALLSANTRGSGKVSTLEIIISLKFFIKHLLFVYNYNLTN